MLDFAPGDLVRKRRFTASWVVGSHGIPAFDDHDVGLVISVRTERVFDAVNTFASWVQVIDGKGIMFVIDDWILERC